MPRTTHIVNEWRWQTGSAEQTVECGRSLARLLRPGCVVLLKAPMGAGKTTLVKGIVEGFEAGAAEDVSSPTFTIMHEYRAAARVLHLDLYRLETEKQVRAIGVDEWLDELRESAFDEPSLLLVEWGERFPALWPAERFEIEIVAADDTREIRLLELGASGPPVG
jgi:tRNA threonylcarbamoyladenosine biosynthesis protein TsaE